VEFFVELGYLSFHSESPVSGSPITVPHSYEEETEEERNLVTFEDSPINNHLN